MKKFKVWSFSHQCLEWRISWFLNFEYWVYVHINGNIVYIIHSAKIFANPTLYLNLTSSKLSKSIKIIIVLSTVILPSPLYQFVRNVTLILFSYYYSSLSRLYKYLSVLFSYWSNRQLLLLTFGSFDNLCIRAEFSISLCTEDDMLNATETAVCNPSDFY